MDVCAGDQVVLSHISIRTELPGTLRFETGNRSL